VLGDARLLDLRDTSELTDCVPYYIQNVVADLVAVIQEQQKRIDALERTVAAR